MRPSSLILATQEEKEKHFAEVGQMVAVHHFSDEEKDEVINLITKLLKSDKDVSQHFPMTNSEKLFEKFADGLILAKLINEAVPDTIDLKNLRLENIKTFDAIENNAAVIKGAKDIGCQVSNITPADLSKGTPHLVFGLLWQILKIGRSRRADLASRELKRSFSERVKSIFKKSKK